MTASRPNKFIKKKKTTKTSKWKPWTQVGLSPLATSRYSNIVSLNEYEFLVATEYMSASDGGIYGFNALTNTWQCRSSYPRKVQKCFEKYSVEISITLSQSRDQLFVFTLNWKRSYSLFKINLNTYSYHIYVQNNTHIKFETLPLVLHSHHPNHHHRHHHHHKHNHRSHSSKSTTTTTHVGSPSNESHSHSDSYTADACKDSKKEVLHLLSIRPETDMHGCNYIHKLFNVSEGCEGQFMDPLFDIKQDIKRMDDVVDIRGTGVSSSSSTSSSSSATTPLKMLVFGGSESDDEFAKNEIWIYNDDDDDQRHHNDDDTEEHKQQHNTSSPLTKVQHTTNDAVPARDPKQRIHSIVCTNDHKFVILFGVKRIFVYDLVNAYCSMCCSIKYPESSDYSAVIVSTSVHDNALLNGYIYQHCYTLEIPKEIIVLIGKFFKQEYVHLIERGQITPMHWSVPVDALLADSQITL